MRGLSTGVVGLVALASGVLGATAGAQGASTATRGTSAAALGTRPATPGTNATTLGANATTLGPGNSPAAVVKARQEAFKRLGHALKVIHSEVRGASPDVAKIDAAAAEVKSAASHLGEWFPAGTGPEAGLKTHAKADIWTDGRGFAAARAAFSRQAEKSARQLTDPAERPAWKDAAAALGQSCRDCHDSYRLKAEE